MRADEGVCNFLSPVGDKQIGNSGSETEFRLLSHIVRYFIIFRAEGLAFQAWGHQRSSQSGDLGDLADLDLRVAEVTRLSGGSGEVVTRVGK